MAIHVDLPGGGAAASCSGSAEHEGWEEEADHSSPHHGEVGFAYVGHSAVCAEMFPAPDVCPAAHSMMLVLILSRKSLHIYREICDAGH